MRVLINASSFGNRPSGALSRFHSLYPSLFGAMPATAFTLVVSADYDLHDEIRSLYNVRVFRLPFRSSNRLLRRLFFVLLPLASPFIRTYDLIEDFSQPPTLLRARRRLLTVHDIRRLELSSSQAAFYGYRLSLWLSERLGYDIVTCSQEMASQLARFYPKDRIHVLYISVPSLFLDHSEGRNCPIDLVDVKGPFIMAVGHLEVRKNYLRLIEAFSELVRHRGGLHLVIVGKDNGAKVEIEALIQDLGLAKCVALLSDISDADLLSLYMTAEALVFPSIYEGFGIPLLEAMATGCPLMISDIEVFREIAGEAALYFDPNDPDAIRASMLQLIDTPGLKEELALRGGERIVNFRPDALARRLTELYRPEGGL